MPLQFTTTGAVAVTLSNGNKTATSTAASGFGAGAYLNEVVAGKCCFALRFDGAADGGELLEMLAGAAGMDFANYAIVGTYISEFTNVIIGNSNSSPTGATLSGAPIVNGDVIFTCIDEPNNLIWVYKNGTIISGAGNPAAGTGGLSGYLISGARIPAVALSNAGGAMTVIDDPVAAGITVPSGFTYLGYSASPTNPPSNTSVPTLSDTTPVVGQTVNAGTGAWTESPTSYAYRWFLDGSVISGQTAASYTLQAADADKALSVGVIATNGIGSSSEAVSADSSPIAHTWQLVGVAVSAVITSGNYTLTLPSGSQSGDVVVAVIAMRSNVGFTVPAGWTQANQDTGGNTTNGTTASDTSSLQAYIIRGGSAPSMVFTRTGGSRALGVVAVYRYTDQSAPPTFDTSVLTPLGAAATAISGTGLTTAAAGGLIVGAVFGARNITVSNFRATDPATGSGSTDTTANPADGVWTERADSLNGTSPTVGIFLADAVRAAAGATGSLLATASASALHAIGAMAFAPPISGGGISASASQSIAVAQSAASAAIVNGASSRSIPVGQSAAASVAVSGASLQTIEVSQSASGQMVLVKATAAQSIAVSQSAAGRIVVASTSATPIPVGQSATAAALVAASSVSTVPVSQNATGTEPIAAAASQPIPVSQIATGEIGSSPSISGSAAQTIGVSQSASAAIRVSAYATSIIGVWQGATAIAPVTGAAAPSVEVQQTATVRTPSSATASQQIGIGQTATVNVTPVTAQATQNIAIGQAAELFVIVQLIGASEISVSQQAIAQQIIIPTPPSRTYRVSPETRLARPAHQSRTFIAALQSRIITARG